MTNTSARPPDAVTLDATDVASGYAERCAADFALIARTKSAFFQTVYDDHLWMDCFDFADHSRRYSTLIKLIFTAAREFEPTVTQPSSTEVNSWFIHFQQRERLTAANVPETLLPTSRGMSAALASATAKLADPKLKTESQSAILLKLQDESDKAVASGRNPLPFTAATVREISASMGLKRPRIVRPLIYRDLDDVDAEVWDAVVGHVHQLREMLLSQLDAKTEHTKALNLTRHLEQTCLKPAHFVFAILDAKECFTALLAENFVSRRAFPEAGAKRNAANTGFVQSGGISTYWLSTGLAAASDSALAAGSDLPEITIIDNETLKPESCSRVVLATDEKAADKAVDSGIAALERTVIAVPLSIWEDWISRGGCPVGTYVDELLEPTCDDDPEDTDDDLADD